MPRRPCLRADRQIGRTPQDHRRVLEQILLCERKRREAEILESPKQRLDVGLRRECDNIHVVCESRIAVKAHGMATDDQKLDVTRVQAQ